MVIGMIIISVGLIILGILIGRKNTKKVDTVVGKAKDLYETYNK